MHRIEILTGSSWRDGRMAERIRHETGADIEFAAILDSVGVLVDGSSISADPPDDAIFLLVRDLMAGCEVLASGSAPRIALPFYESAWELVVRREGAEALVSLYRGGMNPRVAVKDVPVSFADLVHAVVVAGEVLLARLQDLNPGIIADPFVGEMLGALGRLRAADEDPVAAPARAGVHSVQISHEPRGGEDETLAVGFTLTATEGDLLAPTTPNRSDLYSLMAWGRLHFCFEGEIIAQATGRVMFMMESLLLTARHLLTSMEEQRDLDLVQEGESLRIETRYDASADVLTLTLTPLGAGPSRAGSTPAALGGLGALTFVDAVLGAARELRRQILDLNPTQRTNLKFELLSSEVDTLGTWRRDLTGPTIVNTEGHSLRYEMPRQTLPRREQDSGRLVGARRLMYAKRWEAEAEGLRLDATFLCGDRLVLASKQLVAALDRDTGECLWRTRGLPTRSLALMTGETGLVIAGPSGEVSLVDLASGRTQWTTRIAPSPGKPAGVVTGGGRRPRWAVLTTGESGLTAVDLFTGESRWRFTTRRGRPSGFARMGRLLAFTCRSSSVYCVDVDTGDLVWRLSERARFDLPPTSLGEMVSVWMSSHASSAGRILMLDALTGETLWDAPVAGRPLARPLRSGACVVAAAAVPGAVNLVAFGAANGEPAWTRALPGLEGPVAMLALDGAVLVHSALGVVLCVDCATGAITWSRDLVEGPTVDLPMNLEPVLRDGGLFVPLDTTYVLNPADGALLHRLDSDSPVPDLLRVDENYSIYAAELSGHVSAYGVVGHLNVVRS